MTTRRSLAIVVAGLLAWIALAVPSLLAAMSAPPNVATRAYTYDTTRQTQVIGSAQLTGEQISGGTRSRTTS